MKPQFSLATRIRLAFVAFTTFVIIIVGVLAYVSGRAALEEATTAGLLSTSNEKQAALNSRVESSQADITALAADPDMVRHVEHHRLEQESPALRAEHVAILDYLGHWTGQDKRWLSLQILDLVTGQVIAATNPGEEGKFREDQPYFVMGKTGFFVQNLYYSLQTQRPAMTISAPIRASDGSVLAVLAGDLNLSQINGIIARRTGVNTSDEAFLVNTSNLIVTQPRLAPDAAILQRSIHTVAVNRCLARTSGVVTADDYRGVPALISYRWLPKRDLCLIVKIDQAEAFAPVTTLGRQILLIAVALTLCAILLAYQLSGLIAKPILALQAGTARLSHGELDTRLPILSHDELGALTGDFNRMAQSLAEQEAQLRGHAQELEQRVAERTAKLSALSARQQALLAAIPDIVMEVDNDKKYTWANPAGIEFFGDDVLGKSVDFYFEGAQDTYVQVQSLFNGDELTFYVESWQRRKDGEKRLLAWWCRVLKDEQGHSIGALSSARDITERKRAEAALRESEERLRIEKDFVEKLFDVSADTVFVFAPISGKAVRWNEAFRKVTGYTDEEIAALKAPDAYYSPADLVRAGEALERILKEGKSTVELTLLTKEGKGVPFEYNASLLMDQVGSPGLFISTGRDITERVRAEEALRESEERFRSTFESAAMGIAHVSPEGRFLRLNQRFCDIVGYTQEEMLARTFQDITFPADLDADLAFVQQVLADRIKTYSLDKRYIRKDGALVWVNLTVSLLREPSGEPKYFIATIQDITPLKQAEAQVRRANAELEQRVEQRTAELAAANKELEAFSYSVSHDLRAPLRAIVGFTHILLDEHAAQLQPEAQRYLQIVADNTKQMGNLVDDLLAFSRLSHAPLNRQTVHMRALAQRAVDELSAERDGHNIEITLGELPNTQGDPNLLKQVWVNLLSNAFKFTRKRDVARIDVGSARGTGNRRQGSESGERPPAPHPLTAVYFVRDNGVGFDMRYVDKLFSVFQRLHRADEYEGTGVGLAIVQRIIHRHGGRVWAEGTVNEGATFYFTLDR